MWTRKSMSRVKKIVDIFEKYDPNMEKVILKWPEVVQLNVKCDNCENIISLTIDKQSYELYIADTIDDAKGLLFDALFPNETDEVKHLIVDKLCKKCW